MVMMIMDQVHLQCHHNGLQPIRWSKRPRRKGQVDSCYKGCIDSCGRGILGVKWCGGGYHGSRRGLAGWSKMQTLEPIRTLLLLKARSSACCCSAASEFNDVSEFDGEENDVDTACHKEGNEEEEFIYTINDCWRVRPLSKDNDEEIRKVARLQTESFHVGNPIPFIDMTSKRFFGAEVLAELRKKVKYNDAEVFTIFVIEPIHVGASAGDTTNGYQVERTKVCGVIEVSLINEKEILQVLQSYDPDVKQFSYISSMCIEPAYRRKGAASALLTAAEKRIGVWNYDQAILQVHQDNGAAIALYERCGYEVIQQDAAWLAWLNMRPRLLMRKKLVN